MDTKTQAVTPKTTPETEEEVLVIFLTPEEYLRMISAPTVRDEADARMCM